MSDEKLREWARKALSEFANTRCGGRVTDTQIIAEAGQSLVRRCAEIAQQIAAKAGTASDAWNRAETLAHMADAILREFGLGEPAQSVPPRCPHGKVADRGCTECGPAGDSDISASQSVQRIRELIDTCYDTTVPGKTFDAELRKELEAYAALKTRRNKTLDEAADGEVLKPEWPRFAASVRREAFKEIEAFIAGNGREADIQSFVEKKICELDHGEGDSGISAEQFYYNNRRTKPIHEHFDFGTTKGILLFAEAYAALKKREQQPDDGSCTLCGRIPTLPANLCRDCEEHGGPHGEQLRELREELQAYKDACGDVTPADLEKMLDKQFNEMGLGMVTDALEGMVPKAEFKKLREERDALAEQLENRLKALDEMRSKTLDEAAHAAYNVRVGYYGKWHNTFANGRDAAAKSVLALKGEPAPKEKK